MTPNQLKLLHFAARAVGYTPDHLRILVLNTGGVESSKNLSNTGLEDCMAVLEMRGFRQRGEAADYWRNKVALRGRFAGERMVHLIEELAGQVRGYQLPGLCMRFSADRTNQVSKLTPAEAHQLAEMLKQVIGRESQPRPKHHDDALQDELFSISNNQEPITINQGVP